MQVIIVVVTAIILTCYAVPPSELTEQHWIEFRLKFNKRYPSLREEQFRKATFFENLYSITNHNELYSKGIVTYQRGINEYSDLRLEEALVRLSGFNRAKVNLSQHLSGAPIFIPSANLEIPDSVDWRDQGAVTPVKSQGECGSCYAFSATGSLEAQWFLKTGKLVSLSEQNLIDCSPNGGCHSGLIHNCFNYISQHGIDTEEYYPYQGVQGQCRWNPFDIAASDRGFGTIEANNEDALRAAVATIGPISVAIDNAHQSFHDYNGVGVYHEEDCSTEELTHAVLVVGYGTTEAGLDYWIIKNSWSKNWGLEGYMLMARNKNNLCGIATSAVYPIV